jgi:DNA polymerase V
VDRSLKPTTGKVVIESLNGELVVKRYSLREGKPFLLSENASYAPIPLNEDHELVI